MGRGFRNIAVLFFLFVGVVRAETDGSVFEVGGDAYQNTLIQQTLQSSQFTIDFAPEGKRIERVVVVPYDVILSQDLWPDFLNAFHSTTKSDVIERELLFHAGDRWNNALVLESGRNLRNYLMIAIGQIIPVVGSDSDSVVALVVTKDLWSLRTNFDFSYVGSTIQQLGVQLTEENIAGRMKQVSGLFNMDIGTLQFGQQFADPRINGSRLAMNEQAVLINNRSTGKNEGGYGKISFGQPLFSLGTQWAWGVSASLRKDIYRQYFANGVGIIRSPVVSGDLIPYAYKEHLIDLSASVVRSFGQSEKTDFTFGWAAAIHDYGLPDYQYLNYGPSPQPVSQNYFLTHVIPYSERASMLVFGVHRYTGVFNESIDVNTYALTELFRTGPDLNFQMNLANRAFGFDSNYWSALFTAKENWIWDDNVFSLNGSAGIRYQTDVKKNATTVAANGTNWVNRIYSLSAKNVSPKFGRSWYTFRIATGIAYVNRSEDLNHAISSLGGDTNLRGFPSQYLVGPQLLSGNIEIRTQPVAYKSVHFGEAVFFDIGDAYSTTPDFHSSIGFGARLLFPQFNRSVLRLDFAFPLQTVIGSSAANFSAQFGQAF